MNKLQNVSGARRKPDHRLIELSNVNVSLGLNQHQSTSKELKNSRTGGYDTEIARKEQARKKIYKQRAERFKELQSFWENVFPAKYSVCKTTQTQQKEEIGSKHLPNVHQHTQKPSEQFVNTTGIKEEICNQGHINRTIEKRKKNDGNNSRSKRNSAI